MGSCQSKRNKICLFLDNGRKGWVGRQLNELAVFDKFKDLSKEDFFKEVRKISDKKAEDFHPIPCLS
ncbi:MAG: hypothetical protein WCK67_00005 [bacterium]